MTKSTGTSTRIRVTTRTRTLTPPDMVPLYRALTERFGTDEVYLLQSSHGNDRDRRYQFIGFGVVFSLSVTRGVVRIGGTPVLRERAAARLEPLLVRPDGGPPRLRAPTDLWNVLRAVRTMFDAAGSAGRYRFGFLAAFGYDTVRYIEELPYHIEEDPDLPDVQLVVHRGCVTVDQHNGTAELLLHDSEGWESPDTEEIARLIEGAHRTHSGRTPSEVPPAEVSDDLTEEMFGRQVRRCLEHIAVGDIYQVQIGHQLTMRSTADPVDVYLRLQERNASPYMYLASISGQRLIGASPELFVRIEDGLVTMRPIAGTLPHREGDASAAALRLRADPKEVAEHTMLVDLCRNDIGRICEERTLSVPDQLTVERYSHVLHLVSTVAGRAEAGKDSFDTVAATFPAGTMTGAPRIRAMEVIESIERTRRGMYAGALGLIDIGGYTNLALCIRTLFHRDGVFRARASAGVVADSDPAHEWRETLAKLSAVHWAVTGKELL
ncbi:anthranilate synthase component I family protein [Streptomyces sp. ST2-7A]|uniref:anthranilate synthase component I family protein n=1 Tax=Streptomyces sp. ST2-7A TaxID=2907214 RepID=UPI001F1B7EE5|nr:anthranilate synthase component I family protein [Streptomyces sp. ST2-7A]MCE7079490.1 anthranilate synthase component I family protein [Streptomyces sp. ST2-7A]